jgi:hypothetical protein
MSNNRVEFFYKDTEEEAPRTHSNFLRLLSHGTCPATCYASPRHNGLRHTFPRMYSQFGTGARPLLGGFLRLPTILCLPVGWR